MRCYRAGIAFLLGFSATAVAQSLAACAQGCVGVTSSICKATDYSCACSSPDYIPELTTCIERECDVTQFKEAYQFLKDLCEAVGSPLYRSSEASEAEALEKEWKGIDIGGDRLELRQEISLVDGSFTSFPPDTTTFTSPDTTSAPMITSTPNTTPTTLTALSTTARSGAASTRASTSAPTASPTSTGSSNSGLSTGAKVGIGLGVPLAVLIIAGLIGLGYWLGRRNKAPAPNPQPEMVVHELDPNARYHGAELPTKANVSEMPTSTWTGMGGQGVGPAELPEGRR